MSTFGGPPVLGLRHAAVRALVAATAGIVLCAATCIPPWAAVAIAAASFALARLSRGFSLYLAIAAAALLYGHARLPQPPDQVLYGTRAFAGVVVEEPVPGGMPRATVRLSAPARGLVRLWLRDSLPVLRYGDAVAVRAQVLPPDSPRNPGLADYNELALRRGVVGDAGAHATDISIIGRNRGPVLMQWLVMPARRYITTEVNRLLPGDEGALLLGLLLGGSRGLSGRVKTAFSEAGIVHILAVSGMNVAVVVGIAWLLMGVLGIRGWWRFGLGTGVVLLYVSLSGWSAAPARSGVMAVAALLSVPTQRRVSSLASLCTAALVLLVVNPWTVLDIGAQLSFAATLGIVLAASRLDPLAASLRQHRRLHSWVVLPLVVSLAATVATAPLLLHHFFRVQPLAFLTSSLVVPLVGLAMPLGLIVVLAGLVSGPLATIFAGSAWAVLWLLLKLTVLMGRLDWAIWEPGRLSWLWVAWAYGAGLLVLSWKRTWARFALAAVLLVGLNLAVWPRLLRRPTASAVFLDCGRGDAVLLEDSLGRHVLFDAGINGTDVVRDMLRSRGIHRLDAVVVTHPDIDHYGGLLDLDRRCRIVNLVVSVDSGPDTTYNNLVARLKRSGTHVTLAGRGSVLSGTGFGARFLWPDPGTAELFRQGRVPTNLVSLVAMVEYGGFRMLLTGDMEDAEPLSGDSLHADLLKAPHHGSRKGNPESLYDAMQPAHVVVMGRFPTPAGLEQRFSSGPVDYVNARRDGALSIRFLPDGPRFTRY